MGTRVAAQIIALAKESGISADVFPADWQADEFGLYQDRIGAGASFEVAREMAADKAAAQLWVLDLGSKAVSLPHAQGVSLKAKLDDARIPYSSQSVGEAYLRRIRRVTRDHEAILRELAKR